MIKEIGFEDFKRMITGAVEAIRQNYALLTEIDTAIGDGDHGVTMQRAFNNVEKSMIAYNGTDLKGLINEIGWTLLSVDGGATGPLFGSLFLGMVDVVGDRQSLDSQALASIFEGGLAEISKQTTAKAGDKTMMDALIPAVEALRKSADAGKYPLDMLTEAATAAELGANATKNFRARFGRAKYQGDRTLGHPDPGATSTAVIFKGMRDALEKVNS